MTEIFEYGKHDFHFLMIEEKYNKLCKVYHLFGKSEQKEKTLVEYKKETDKQIWKRINKYILEHNLKIINIETIIGSQYITGGPVSKDTISNNSIHGYRIFYKKY